MIRGMLSAYSKTKRVKELRPLETDGELSNV